MIPALAPAPSAAVPQSGLATGVVPLVEGQFTVLLATPPEANPTAPQVGEVQPLVAPQAPQLAGPPAPAALGFAPAVAIAADGAAPAQPGEALPAPAAAAELADGQPAPAKPSEETEGAATLMVDSEADPLSGGPVAVVDNAAVSFLAIPPEAALPLDPGGALMPATIAQAAVVAPPCRANGSPLGAGKPQAPGAEETGDGPGHAPSLTRAKAAPPSFTTIEAPEANAPSSPQPLVGNAPAGRLQDQLPAGEQPSASFLPGTPTASPAPPPSTSLVASPLLPTASPAQAGAPAANLPAPVAAPEPAIAFASPRFAEEVGIAIARRATPTSEASELTLRIAPAELGRIQVQLRFDPSGNVEAVLSADQPRVLEQLKLGQGELYRALVETTARGDVAAVRFETRADTPQPGAQAQNTLLGGNQGQGGGQGFGQGAQQQGRAQPFFTMPDWLLEPVPAAPLTMLTGRVDLLA